MRLTEPYAVMDTFVCGLARVELLKGGNVRFTHFAEAMGEDGTPEHVIVSKIVMPAMAISDARKLTNSVLSGALGGALNGAKAILQKIAAAH